LTSKKSQNIRISKDLHPIVIEMLNHVKELTPVDLFIYEFNIELFNSDIESSKEQLEITEKFINRFENEIEGANNYQRYYIYNNYAFSLYENKKSEMVIEKYKKYIENEDIVNFSYFIDTYACCLVERGSKEDLILSKNLFDKMLKFDKINITSEILIKLIELLDIKDEPNWNLCLSISNYIKDRDKVLESGDFNRLFNIIEEILSNKHLDELSKSLILHEKAHLYVIMQEFEKAIELFKEAIKIKSNSFQNRRRKSISLEYIIWILRNQGASFEELLILFKDYFYELINSFNYNKSIKCLEEISDLYHEMGLNNEAINILQVLSNMKFPPKKIGILLNNIGWIYNDIGDYKAALEYYIKAKDWKEKNNILEMVSYKNLIDAYRNLGDYKKSIELALEGLKYFKSNESEASLYNQLAISYELMGDEYFTDAIKNYRIALEKMESIKNFNKDYFNYYDNLVIAYFDHNDYAETIDAVNEFLKTLEENNISCEVNIDKYLSILLRRARSYNKLKDYASAIKFQKEALEIAEKYQVDDYIRYSLFNLYVYHDMNSEPEIADEYLKKNIEKCKELNNNEALISSYIDRLYLLNREKENDQVIKLISEIEERAKKITDIDTKVLFYNKLAENRNGQFQSEKALELNNEAFKLIEQVKDPNIKADIMYLRGVIYYKLEKYDMVVKFFKEAMKYYEEVGNEKDIAYIYTALGNLYRSIEKYEESKLWHQKAIDMGLKINDLSILSSAYNNIAITYSYEGNNEKAIELFKKALDIDTKLNKKWSIALCTQNIGIAYYNLDQNQLAYENLGRAIKIFEEINKLENVLNCLRFQAEIKYWWADYKESLELYEKALYLGEKLKVPIDEKIYSGIAQNKWQLGQYQDAVKYYEIAYKKYEQKCSNLKISEFRMVFRKQYLSILEGLSASILNLEEGSRIDNIKKALGILEIGKARELLGQVESDVCQICPKKEQYMGEINRLKERQLRLNEMKDNLMQSHIDSAVQESTSVEKEGSKSEEIEISQKSDIQNTINEIEKELEDIFWKIEDIQDKIWRECSTSGASTPNNPKEIIDRFVNVISQYTDEKWALIELSYSRKLNQLFIYWIDYTGDISVDRIKFSEKKMGSIAALSAALIQLIKEEENFDEAEEFLEKMSNILFKLLFPLEIRSRLVGSEYEYLMIIPCDALTNIPWECIQLPDGQYLGEKFALSRGFNLDLIRASIESVKKYVPTGKSLIYGNPNKGEILKVSEIYGIPELQSDKQSTLRSAYEDVEWDASLDAAEKEANTIHEIIENSDYGNSNLFTGKSATKKSFLNNLKTEKFDIFHFAGHAVFNPKEPDLSYLLFNKGEKLYASEIPDSACFKGKPLVVFSACESGLADTMPGDEVFGIVRGLMLAGAYDMVLSGWPVFDESTYPFMKSFYENLLRGKPVSKAIRDARIELRKKIDSDDDELPPWKLLCIAPFRYFGNPFKKIVNIDEKLEVYEKTIQTEASTEKETLLEEVEMFEYSSSILNPKENEILDLLDYEIVKESLELEKANKKEEAKQKLNKFLEELWEKAADLYDEHDYEKSAKTAEACIKIARYPLVNNKELLAKSFNTFANSIDEHPINDHKGALKCWLKSLKMFEDINNILWQGHILSNIAFYYRNQNNPEKEMEFRLHAFSLYSKIKDSIYDVEEISKIMSFKYKYHEYEEVVKWGEKGLNLITTKEKMDLKEKNRKRLFELKIRLLKQIGDSYDFLNDRDNALKYYKLGLKISTDPRDILYFTRFIGSQYRIMKNYDEAFNYYQKGLKLAKEIKNYQELYWFYWNLNKYYIELGDYEKAVEVNKKQLDVSVELKDYNKEASTLFDTALNLYELKRYDESMEYYLKCNTCIEEHNINAPALHALALGNIGGNYFTQKNFEEAIKYFKKAIDEYENVVFRDVRINKAWVYRKYGDCLFYTGRYEESIHPFNESFKLYSAIEDGNAPFVALDLAESYKKLNKYDKVVEYYTIYLENAIKIKNPNYEVLGNFEIGFAYYNINKYFEAEKYIRRAISLYYEHNLDNSENLAHYYYRLAQVLDELKKPDESIDNFSHALELYKKIGKTWSISITSKVLGYTLKKYEKYNEAAKYFKEAAKLFIEQGYNDEAAICIEQLGVCYYSTGDLLKAIETYYEAISYYEKVNQENNIAYVYTKIGNTHYELGMSYFDEGNESYIEEFEKSIDANMKCIEIMERYSDTDKNFAISYRNMANSARKIPNNIDNAVNYYKKSIELYKKIDEFLGVADDYKLMAEAYSDNKIFEKAIESLENAIEYYEKIDSNRNIGHCYRLMGKTYTMSKQYEKALELLDITIDKYNSIDRRDDVALTLEDIAKVFMELNQKEKALQLLNESLEIFENLNLPIRIKECKKLIKEFKAK